MENDELRSFGKTTFLGGLLGAAASAVLWFLGKNNKHEEF